MRVLKKKNISPSIKTGVLVLLSLLVACTGSRTEGGHTGYYKSEEFPRLEKKPVVQSDIIGDPGLFFYRNEATRDKVVAFYTEETGLEEISRAVVDAAERNEIPLPLAFSLCWVESRYNPMAINRNSSSLDRGLFQLNSRSFPELDEEDFFSIEVNSKYGMAYLRYCLDVGENEFVALAMYNAGRHRVTNRGAPVSTLEYISRIVDYQERLEERFLSEFLKPLPGQPRGGGERLVKAVQASVKNIQ